MIHPVIDTVIVLAKPPVPGRVKTRLLPEFTAEQAAVLAAAALLDTLDAVDSMPVRHRLLAFDGVPGSWLRPGWRSVRQPAGDLAMRMAAAFAAAPAGSAALVAMDTPQVRAVDFNGFDPARHDALLGPTADGGYWTIGFRDRDDAGPALTAIPMSQPFTRASQLARLEHMGLSVHMLGTMVDVDTACDAAEVAASAPATRFAAAHDRLRAPVSTGNAQ